jgi:hypothetical protein
MILCFPWNTRDPNPPLKIWLPGPLQAVLSDVSLNFIIVIRPGRN